MTWISADQMASDSNVISKITHSVGHAIHRALIYDAPEEGHDNVA
jgi:hypothetical protein